MGYSQDTNTWPRRVAVYGTLLPDQPNFALVRELKPEATPALVPGFRLVGRNHGFPYALPARDAMIVASVLEFTHDTWDEARTRMDNLEGYPVFYDRVRIKAETDEGVLDAWIYTPASPAEYETYPEVPGNDWAAWEAERPMPEWRYDRFARYPLGGYDDDDASGYTTTIGRRPTTAVVTNPLSVRNDQAEVKALRKWFEDHK